MSNGSPWRLDGATALVTGASQGIGLASVRELVERGATVIANARNVEPLEGLEAVIAVGGDLTTDEGQQAVVSAVRGRGVALDVLVNNAGRNLRKPTLEYTSEDFDAVIDLNLKALWRLTTELHPFLSGSGRASVINVSSVAAARAVRPSTAAYAASKGGVDALTRYLASEWAPQGIRVNAVSPWYIRTPLAEPILADPAKAGPIIERTPLGRVGEPEDVARAIAFLALPASGWITGGSPSTSTAASTRWALEPLRSEHLPGTGDVSPSTCAGSPQGHCHEPGACLLIGGGDAAHLGLEDIDADGNLDAAAVIRRSEASQLVVAYGDGDGGFGSTSWHDIAGLAHDVAVADIDGNGIMDIVIAAAGPDRIEVRTAADLDAATVEIGNVGPTPFALALADVVGNASLEVLSIDSTTSGQIQIHNLIGEVEAEVPTGAGPQDIDVADFDGDGDLDIVTVDPDEGTATGASTVALNQGDGTFSSVGPVNVAMGRPTGVATGDFNGDGWPDYARAVSDINTVYLVPGNGDGDFGTPIAAYITDGNPTRFAAADIDADGYDDIISGFANASVVRIFWGFPADPTKLPASFDVPSPPWDVATGDLNDDGIPDIVSVSAGGGGGQLCPIVSAP